MPHDEVGAPNFERTFQDDNISSCGCQCGATLYHLHIGVESRREPLASAGHLGAQRTAAGFRARLTAFLERRPPADRSI